MSARYDSNERYVPQVGPHRWHVVRVVRVRRGEDYDVVRVVCECRRTWRFLHHHGSATWLTTWAGRITSPS